jgi:hypothetical protein
MPELLNLTPFSATTFGLLDKQSRQFDVIIISATFEALPGKPVRLADEQSPVRDSDEYYGKPGFSSVRYEGEIALEKPFVDVLVNGRAFAPQGRKTGKVLVSLRIGNLQKDLQVSGDRYWRRGLLGIKPSSPKPFETVPIVYERAFGGIDTRPSDSAKHYSDPRNPIGIGFQRASAQTPVIETEVPNIEYPSQLLGSPNKRPEPAGLGIVGRSWQPRIGFAGTYDEAWVAEQFPLLPLDLDPRYYQAAPRDQQSDTIRGGELVEILNMSLEGRWQFTLPTLDVPVRLWSSDRGDAPLLKMDTVLLEPDAYRVTLIGRTKIPILRNRAQREEIILGHVSPAWWRAQLKGKIYLDWAGRGGRRAGVSNFRL